MAMAIGWNLLLFLSCKTTNTRALQHLSVWSTARSRFYSKPCYSLQQQQQIQSTAEQTTNQCNLCSCSFESRNALFRHLQLDPICSPLHSLATIGTTGSTARTTTTKHTLALYFSYWGPNCRAKDAGSILSDAVTQAMEKYYNTNNDMSTTTTTTTFISSTQSTVAKMRHLALSQEDNCAASGDVMIWTAKAPLISNTRNFLTQILTTTNQLLLQQQQSTTTTTTPYIRLDACKYITDPQLSRLHAERSCTQRVYHYLMPIQWLPNGTALEQWWLLNNNTGHENRASTRPPTNTLQVFKEALKCGESAQAKHQTALVATSTKIATGRFGALGNKERRPWHNYADPTLKGDASPNNEPVWTVLDRARMIQFITINNNSTKNQQVLALLEFKGDGFLKQQVRRMVGTAIAVAHGWLPPHVVSLSTTPDTVMETPLAPEGRMYLAEAKFHFDEMKCNGKSIFDSDSIGLSVSSANYSMAKKLIQTYLLSERQSQMEEEAAWLKDLERNVAPRIQSQLLTHSKEPRAAIVSNEDTNPTSGIYARVLELLRAIVAEESWPETSVARSSVIANVIAKQPELQRGSFTVINPHFGNGVDSDGFGIDKSLPLGNSLFPELVQAVFDLELELATDDGEGRRRPASSHCAINANAQFAPHVDSGRGAGQSLSMIVGLGNYNGGELAIEGEYHDIRYNAVQFDGWKLRHWTTPFVGERFSLVWFTPEGWK